MTTTPNASDTLPAAERFLIEGFRRMPGWRKLQRVDELNALTRALALADIRRRYAGAGAREVRRQLAVRQLGPALANQCFGDPPDREDA